MIAVICFMRGLRRGVSIGVHLSTEVRADGTAPARSGEAEAYRRHGLRYYPKLLGAVPFTPVPGTRLLVRDEAMRSVLVHALHRLARDAKLSSAHVLFVDDADRAAFESAGWMIREGVQF